MRRLRFVPGLLVTLLAVPTACDGDTESGGGAAGSGPIDVHLGDVVDAAGEGSATLTVEGDATVVLHLDGRALVLEVDAAGAQTAEILAVDGPPLEPAAEPYPGGVWLRPRPVADDAVELRIGGEGASSVTIAARGEPVPAARRERSLFWTEPGLVDDPTRVGLERVLAAASDDGHGGVMFQRWLHRFATTVHSERAGPAQLADAIAVEQGDDASQWDLGALPFVVTGVHNRLDLSDRGEGCGELRVSIASTHPIYAPLHVLFLFRQEPRVDDARPDGTLHCLGTARRWARLSTLDGSAFVEAAGAWLDEALVHERFLLAETVELTVSPWEWRQWSRVGADELDNPALFQTVDVSRVNQPGPVRDAFLAFVEANAEGLEARTVTIPPQFRAASARVPPSAPAERLSLEGLAPSVLAARPELAEAIEIIGCPRCHTANANFVQTSVEREPSPFYDLELDARAERLDRLNSGSREPLPPFGPLQ